MGAWLSPPVAPFDDKYAAKPWEDRLKAKLVEYGVARKGTEYFSVIWEPGGNLVRPYGDAANDGITFRRVVDIAQKLRGGDADMV
ncbi:hypothetical protein [Streptomyces sp. NBC_01264]|uniref:hypothetical protein n=1 Tax=Streptomyces sp. NBC_01264 TaxID=2903804 RepID=UPI0022568D60|nr:hypothetical protein [Streptomyces sp. NBC_01264]MCX4776802.1 hypothetical protein [Streptomyces sp. NBC_01264]